MSIKLSYSEDLAPLVCDFPERGLTAWKGKDLPMDNKVPHKQVEIKHVGQAVECGTLEVFLNIIVHQPVLLMPLERTIPSGSQYMRQWAMHVTARPSSTSPVYYATFHAAEVLGMVQTMSLTYPYRFHGKSVLARAQILKLEVMHLLQQELMEHPRVSEVITPARYRLPDEWVWAAKSTSARLIYHHEHWMLKEVEA